MKTKIMLALLAITLAACTPAQTSTTDIKNTAIAIVQTGVALTQTALPTSTSPATPTPAPPNIPILTPDAVQVEKWKEYQMELAKALFSFSLPNQPEYDPEEYKDALCEWDILGRSSQEVYVWAVCGVGERSGSVPAVIYLNADGSIQNVKKTKNWSVENIHKMFPEDVRNKFYYVEAGETQKMSEHLAWREAHPGEPPLIILSTTPVVTPIP